MITHGSTFSGIGAPEIAAEMLGWRNVFHCEINPFGRKVLDYYFPEAKSYEDITKTDFSEWGGQIDVLTGGFPCQPFSYAGKRRGSEDDRYLWPYMLKCIEQVRPTWFVGENVAGITTMVFPGEDVKVGGQTDIFGTCDEILEKREHYVLDEICQSLERTGYSVQPLLIPACAVGAPHRRDRVFIVAHLTEQSGGTEGISSTSCEQQRTTGNTADNGLQHDSERQGCNRSVEASHGEGCSSEQALSAETSGSSRPTPDPSCSGSGAQAESDRLISEWRDRLSLASQRGDSPQRTDGLSALQGHTSYTDSGTFDNGESGIRASGEPQVSKFRECICQSGTDISGLHPDQRWRAFPSVSPVYRGNDGFPFDVDHLTILFSEWRRESLKAYGNAIVPQVMYEIFRMIDQIEKQNR